MLLQPGALTGFVQFAGRQRQGFHGGFGFGKQQQSQHGFAQQPLGLFHLFGEFAQSVAVAAFHRVPILPRQHGRGVTRPYQVLGR